MPAATLTVCDDPAAIAALAARRIAAAAREAVDQRFRFTLILAGGSTPRALYTRLATVDRDSLPWDATTMLFGDERCVGPEHADSNYRMVHESLLSSLPPRSARVYRIRGELGASAAASEYDVITHKVRNNDPEERFDVVLLGMGADGHTASLFPGRDFSADAKFFAAPAIAPPASPVRDRVTLTLRAIADSRRVLFLVAGQDKREMLARVLAAAQSGGDPSLPASMIRSSGTIEWIVDRGAAPVP
ncbi:MAG: 6-phosphogluconolactonase [Phycisphaerales bacterium]|nr:6-phosphogluconolactonase [Phycisphaerales bacterium]